MCFIIVIISKINIYNIKINNNICTLNNNKIINKNCLYQFCRYLHNGVSNKKKILKFPKKISLTEIYKNKPKLT